MTQKQIHRRDFLVRSFRFAGTAALLACFPSLDPVRAGSEKVIDSFLAEPGHLQELLRSATRRGGDFADIFIEQKASRHVRMVNGRIELAEDNLMEGLGIRVITNGKAAFSTIDDLLLKNARKAAREVRRAVQKQKTRPEPARLSKRPQMDAGVFIARKKLDRTSRTDVLSVLEQLHGKAGSISNLVTGITLDYYDEIRRILVAGSDGTFITDSQPSIDIDIECTARRGRSHEKLRQRISHRCGFDLFTNPATERRICETAFRAVESLSAKPLGAGSMPIAFYPEAAAALTHFVFQAASGNYPGGESEGGLPPVVSLIDDGRVVNGRGSSHFDDEGIRTSETVLIDNGRPVRMLNRRTGAKNEKPLLTGNGRRADYRCLPVVSPTNIYLKIAGQVPAFSEDLFTDGLLVTGAVPVHSGNDPSRIQVRITSGYRIENRRKMYPVRDVIVSGKLNDILNRIIMAGDTIEFSALSDGGERIPIGYGAPAIVVSSMDIENKHSGATGS